MFAIVCYVGLVQCFWFALVVMVCVFLICIEYLFLGGSFGVVVCVVACVCVFRVLAFSGDFLVV